MVQLSVHVFATAVIVGCSAAIPSVPRVSVGEAHEGQHYASLQQRMHEFRQDLDAVGTTALSHASPSANSRSSSAPFLHQAATNTSRVVLSASQSKVRASKKQPAEPMVIAATDATNAAIAAQNAEHSAAIAMHVAARSEQIAQDAAAALRYTEWALERAHLGGRDAAELGRAAEGLDAEVGRGGSSSELQRLEAELERLEDQYARQEGSEAGGDAALRQRIQDLRRDLDGAKESERQEGLRRELAGIEQEVGGMEVSAARGGHKGDAEAEADLEALRQRIRELEGQLGEGNKYSTEHVVISGSGPGGGSGNYGAGYDAGYDAGRTQAGGPLFDINSQPVPFPLGGEAPFGRQTTGNQLTASSVTESEGMVDQIEQAQSMESKRAVYRALTRLRGLTIASYDSIAKAHMANVDEYARTHKWRETHHIRHLAEEEADIDNWAFPMGTHASAQVPAIAAAPCPPGVVAAPSPAPAL